ncbi:MAG: AEC family transporter [Gemmiger sp.]
MVNMTDLIDLQITIFLLMGAGYVMTRWGILPISARKPLTDLVIDFILPCNIIVSFMMEFDLTVLAACLVVLLVSVGIQLFTTAAGRLFYPRAKGDEVPVLQYATLVSNAGFLGSPIVEGLYGAQGLLYASIYLIPQRIMMWSAGVSCFTGIRGKGVVKKVLTHPCIVAVAIGLVLMLSQAPLPGGLEKTLRLASGCNTALSMIVIGNILAEVDPRTVISRQSLWYCAVRLLLLPLLVLAACRLLALDSLVSAVSTVLAGMPAAATTAILAAKYGRGEHFAVSLVFLSTLLSLVTIPALCLLMQFL